MEQVKTTLQEFLELMKQKKEPSVLEIGVKRADPSRSTMRKEWVPHAKEYIGTDYQPGPDVDMVSDAHYLSETFGENRFDAIIVCSVYEHLQYPWLASVEICRVLKPGGLAFVQTHQTFPLHSYPWDYYRYTTDGLKTLFSKQAGFSLINATHELPCKIVSDDVPSDKFPAFLIVSVLAEKAAHPDKNFRYQAEKRSFSEGDSSKSSSEENQLDLACSSAERLHGEIQSKEFQMNAVYADRYRQLKHHAVFNGLIRFGDHLINYPPEAKDLKERHILARRYERLESHWFFGPIVRLGNRFIKTDED